MIKTTLKLTSLAIMLVLSQPLWATNKALLIGISDYQNKKDKLEGPVNDVVALKNVLQQYWGFSAQNIKTLVNYDATKANILAELKTLAQTAKADDHIFIYFSGHGSSALDKGMNLPLPYSSGALVPVEFSQLGVSKQQIVDSLLVGRRDLKPVLSKLDQSNANIFIAFDSCYSGQSVRGLGRQKLANSRVIPIYELMDAEDAEDASANSGELNVTQGSTKIEPYPYKNIVYLSASSAKDPARDISSLDLSFFPTIDNQAHGAFTNALLYALSGKIKTDLNSNGQTDYGEIHSAVKDFMVTAGYPHTPQILPTVLEDRQQLHLRRVLGTQPTQSYQAPSKPSPSFLTISLPVDAKELRSKLKQLPQVQVTEQNADLTVSPQGRNYQLINKAGDVISTLLSPSLQELVGRIKQEAWKKHFKQQLQQRASINMAFNVKDGLEGDSAIEGDLVVFTIRPERSVYLLLLDVDAQGNLAVLYPFREHELALIPGRTIKYIPSEQKNDWIKVQKPTGVDHLIAIGFAEKPTFLAEFVGKETLNLQSDLYTKLLAYIKTGNYGYSELDFLTLPKKVNIQRPHQDIEISAKKLLQVINSSFEE